MAERRLAGVPAAPGLAVGPALLLVGPAEPQGDPEPLAPELREAEAALAASALGGAAAELDAIAADARTQGRADEAAIVEAGAMMARDPELLATIDAAVRDSGRPAAHAIAEATAAAAGLLASIPDPTLAARAEDVRSVGRRAVGHVARLAGGAGDAPAAGAAPAPPGSILVAEDLGPADLAELGGEVVAVALAEGSPTAHAAVVARSRGVPMVVGLGAGVLGTGSGAAIAVDGDEGVVVLDPAPALAERAAARAAARTAALRRARAERDLPATTTDGRRLRVLANVAGVAELEAALDAGAEGAGLIRTELGFLDAADWPDRAAHEALLRPLLERLERRTATVRLLDFGGDKLPPFLAGSTGRGIGLLLEHPAALGAQAEAIVATVGEAGVRVLLPLVERTEEIEAVAAALSAAADRAGLTPPPVGAMVETPAAADAAAALASRSAFLSVGTNDLSAATHGVDRFAAGASPAHDPRVLRHIGACSAAARAAGIPLEVCGEAASDPLVMPLLVGLGVDELSVGAARVGTVRAWVRSPRRRRLRRARGRGDRRAGRRGRGRAGRAPGGAVAVSRGR
jgi:phosphoenolpyruvate-protein kinase (PTS system EI component)